MKKRVIWKMFVFTILTLGIYRLYWFVKTRREMMQLDPSLKIMSPLFLIIPVVLMITAFATLMISSVQSYTSLPSYCTTAPPGSTDRYTTTVSGECNVDQPLWPLIFFYVAILAIGPLIAVWLWGYSKAVEKITKEKTSFAMAMIVLLLVPDGIDILIVQDGFNKVAAPQVA